MKIKLKGSLIMAGQDLSLMVLVKQNRPQQGKISVISVLCELIVLKSVCVYTVYIYTYYMTYYMNF